MTVGGKHAVFALTPNVQSRVCPSPSVSPDTYHHSLITNKPLPTMVAINGREVIGRAVGIFHTYYNLFFSKLSFTRLPGSLGGSASSVRRRASIRVTPNDPVSKGRKKGRGVTGSLIYEHLLKNNMLVSCLGFADGLEIQKKGNLVFRKFFNGKGLYLWNSVAEDLRDGLQVSFLAELGDEVVMGWRWLGHIWDRDDPAARFPS